MNEVLKKIGGFGLVPVVKIKRADDVLPLRRALSKGGLPVAEITFRTSAAVESIKVLTRDWKGGAGGYGRDCGLCRYYSGERRRLPEILVRGEASGRVQR